MGLPETSFQIQKIQNDKWKKIMQIIYVHGLHSGAQSLKGNLLRDYCAAHYPEITFQSPDLNHQPEQVMQILRNLIAKDKDTVLVGSSLGGFFSTLLHDEQGVRVVLLNPSVKPYETLLRFFPENWQDLPDNYPAKDEKATTWLMTLGDLRWFATHQPKQIRQPEKVRVLLQTGDELLDYREAVAYYQGCDVQVEEGGDHRMSDFADKVSGVVAWALQAK